MQSIRDMYESAEWLDMTAAGSSYEVQLNQRTGQYRHRPRQFGMPDGHSLEGDTPETAWRMGQPKEGFGNG